MLDHFNERQRTHTAVPGLLVFGGVIEAVIALVRHGSLPLQITQWVIVGVFVALAVCFRELRMRVGPEDLIFGFGPFRRRVPLTRIASVRIIDSSVLPVGIGIHRVVGDLVAWIAQKGPAVEIKIIRQGERQTAGYVLSTARPHDLASALQSGKSSRAVEGP